MHKKIIIGSLIAFLVGGCDSSDNISHNSNTQRSVQTVVSVETAQFSDAVVNDTLALSTSVGNNVLTTAIVPQGTQFETIDGYSVSSVNLQIAQRETETLESSVNETVTTKRVTSEYRFVDEEGNKIVPTEPIEISIAAPTGLTPGDEVEVAIFEEDNQEKTLINQKLTIEVVDANGNIRTIVYPYIFMGRDIVVVVVRGRIVEFREGSVTGAEGEN